MTRYRAIGYVLGQFLLALAGTMLIPLGYGLLAGGDGPLPLVYASVITASVGALLLLFLRRPTHDLTQREGLLMVVSIWLAVAFFGSLPFYASPHFVSFTDAMFEAVSGFTTTGATILLDVEVLPPALQFWRCFSHWLGGMGILVLGIAVLPLVGHGGMQLYRAEFSGASSERLTPRIKETAKALSGIYVAMTVALYIALRLAGMNNFDALCHTFSTLGTGGFSTRTESIAAFKSPLIESIIVLFMLAAGMSFVQHYRLWIERRPRSVFADIEIRYYFVLILVATLVITGVLVGNSGYEPLTAFRSALFQVGSIVTTTGFVTDDFHLWVAPCQVILLACMFLGGCTGSTAGGMKVARLLLLFRVVDREFKRMVERRGVFSVRFGGQHVTEETIRSLLNLVYLAFMVNVISCLLLSAMGIGVLTAIAAVAASMFNVGPGLGAVGPAETYAHLPLLAKWVLAGDMIAGRLEFYAVLVILNPAFWRK